MVHLLTAIVFICVSALIYSRNRQCTSRSETSSGLSHHDHETIRKCSCAYRNARNREENGPKTRLNRHKSVRRYERRVCESNQRSQFRKLVNSHILAYYIHTYMFLHIYMAYELTISVPRVRIDCGIFANSTTFSRNSLGQARC